MTLIRRDSGPSQHATLESGWGLVPKFMQGNNFPRSRNSVRESSSSAMARIFVLDDEDSIVRTWVLILTKFGHETIGFSHPQDALAAIRKDPPELLVSDVGLPGMTGIELAIHLAKEKIPTKVLLCSGQTVTADYLDEAAEQGYHFTVLPKPVGPPQLLKAITDLLAGKAASA